MKLTRKRAAILGLVILLAVLACILYEPALARKEPRYQGKALTYWLKQLDNGEAFGISSGSLPSFTRRQRRAADAIRAMGAEALPLLLQDIHSKPPEGAFRFKFERKLKTFIGRFSTRQLFFDDITAEDRVRWRAAQGLAALGPLAKTAVPELKRLLFTNYFHSSIKEAAYALAAIGPEGFQVLTNAVLQSGEEWSAMCAIWALGQHPSAGTNAIPCLIIATTSPSEGTACGAIQVLGLLRADAEQVIPALINALTNSNVAVRHDAVHALGEFGPDAVSAMPILVTMTNNPVIADEALAAIKKIADPQKR